MEFVACCGYFSCAVSVSSCPRKSIVRGIGGGGAFVIWKQPAYEDQFTQCALEQYKYMVSVQGSAAQFIRSYSMAYEASGKELHLAKAAAFANAMTALQNESGGNFVNTYWKKARNANDWIRVMLEFGELLKRRRAKLN